MGIYKQLQVCYNLTMTTDNRQQTTSKKQTLREMGYTTVVAAAKLYSSKISVGSYHADCLSDDEFDYADVNDHHNLIFGKVHKSIFGYVDSDGKFINKGEAWSIAEKNGLLDESPQSFTKYSEDYYRFGKSEFDIGYAKAKIKENLKIEKKKAKDDFSSMVYQDNRQLKNDLSFEFIEDYLWELPYLEKCKDAQKVLTERITEIISR